MSVGLAGVGRKGVSSGARPEAPFDPYSISGLILDLNADVGVTKAAGLVSDWANQGGAGGSFTQATGGNKPAFNAAGLNGKAAIVFDGTDDFFSSAIALTSIVGAEYTAFALASYQTSTAPDTAPYNFTPLVNEPVGPYGSLFAMGGTEVSAYLFDSGPHRATDSGLDTSVHVFTQRLAGTTLSLQVDDGTVHTATVGAMSAGSGNCVMCKDYNGTHFLGATLRRLLVWNVALTAPQIAQVKAYLASF